MTPRPSDLVPGIVRKRHARKLAVAFALVVVVIASIGAYVFVETTDQLHDHTENELETTAEVQARELAQWNSQMREEARLLSRTDEVTTRDPEGIRAFLQEETSSDSARLPEEIAAIHYLDTEEFVIRSSTNEAFVGVSPREEGVPWAQDGLSFEGPDDTIVTQPFDAPNLDSPAVAVVSPVPDQPDRALVMMVSLESRIASMPRPSGEDSFTMVVDGQGTNVLAHNRSLINSQHVGGPGVEAESVKQGLAGETGYGDIRMGDRDLALGYAPVEGTDWVVITHVPKAEAFALQETITRSLGAILVVAILGLGAVALTIGRSTASALDDLTAKAAQLEDGDLDADLESDRVDEIGRLYDAFGNMRDALQERIAEVERARERTERINSHLEAKADEYRDVMDACAAGDMSARMDADSESEAMTEIARSFNGMMDRMEVTTARLKTFAGEVAAASEEVTASAEEVRSASDQVSRSVQEINEGTDRQREQFAAVENEMTELSATVQEIASSANEVSEIADGTAEAGQRGRERVEDARETMTEVASEAEQSVAEFERLRESLADTAALVDDIAGIATRTNTLALNANIEAARSTNGDEEGFAVVAGNVKDLASEAKEVAEEAEAMIDDLQHRATEAAQEVRETSQKATASVHIADEAADALERIAEHTETTAAGIEDVSAVTRQQASAVQEVTAMVEDAAEISEETAQNSQAVAAAAEEQTSALSAVTRSASQLAEQSVHLSEGLDRFTTRDPAAAGLDRGALDGALDPAGGTRPDPSTATDADDPETGTGTGQFESGVVTDADRNAASDGGIDTHVDDPGDVDPTAGDTEPSDGDPGSGSEGS